VSSAPGGAEPFVGAGDIASCTSAGDEATAALLDGIAGTVFTLGDNVYDNGTATEFANCYDPSWGQHKSRTTPVAGNHDYNTSGATGYYDYFGDAAGPRDKGYYSFDLGAWHIIILNSNIARTLTSEQIAWLRADLTGSTAQCTMALWHHPRFSSGQHGNDATQQPFWDVLYEFDADVVLVGHDHDYERFAPQTPTGVADPTRGLRQFVVGTGGTSLRSFSTIRPNSEFRDSSTWGVIKFELAPTRYSWSYITTTGGAVLDSGSGSCH
jgi:acid phosphatase type 7